MFQDEAEKVKDERRAGINDGGFLFRFRSPKALLDDDFENGGFQELERQTIYFAKPENLNDPMEGLSDNFWKGDRVLWENLFRNYAISLVSYVGKWLLFDSEEVNLAGVDAWPTEDDLPSDSCRALYREFSSSLCAEIESNDLAVMLERSAIPLRRERLISLLFLIHQNSLSLLFRALKKHGLTDINFPREQPPENHVRKALEGWEEIALSSPGGDIKSEDLLEVMSSISNRMSHQLDLEILSRLEDTSKGYKLLALISRFPEMYVDAFLRDLHFTPWRVACFSQKCVNASMWGTYGHEHRGAALVFRPDQREGGSFIRIKGMIGSGPKGHDIDVRSVKYINRPPPVDAFLQIGRLPMKKLEDAWMTSESGEVSSRLTEMTRDMGAWRKKHWETAFERATWKHPDWRHEDEKRLIVTSLLSDDPAPEPLTYCFSQLEGIVFGMRMSADDKLRIVKIIESKCRAENRSDFRFFQAYYSSSKGEMDISELGLLKFDV